MFNQLDILEWTFVEEHQRRYSVFCIGTQLEEVQEVVIECVMLVKFSLQLH